MKDENKMILGELKEVQSSLARIQNQLLVIEHKMIDPDSILDEEDLAALNQVEKEAREGRLVSLRSLKQELRL